MKFKRTFEEPKKARKNKKEAKNKPMAKIDALNGNREFKNSLIIIHLPYGNNSTCPL